MSAHCDTCGNDLVYPPGSWPLGECPCCKRDEEISRLRRYISVLETVRGDVMLLLTWLDRDAADSLNWTDGRKRRNLVESSVAKSYEFKASFEAGKEPE
jgi:hypothetical protein